MMCHKINMTLIKVLILVLLTSCSFPNENFTETSKKLSVTEAIYEQAYFDTSARVDFVLDLIPSENSKITLEFYNAIRSGAMTFVLESAKEDGYRSSICVKPYFPVLIQKGDNWVEINDITERMRLLVNGEAITDISASGLAVSASLTNIPDNEWIDGLTYCWLVPLEAGIHQAEFSFVQSSGDVKSYSWQFEIIP